MTFNNLFVLINSIDWVLKIIKQNENKNKKVVLVRETLTKRPIKLTVTSENWRKLNKYIVEIIPKMIFYSFWSFGNPYPVLLLSNIIYSVTHISIFGYSSVTSHQVIKTLKAKALWKIKNQN